MTKVLIIVFFLTSSFGSYSDGEDCINILKEYSQRMLQYKNPDPAKTYKLEMGVKTIYKKGLDIPDTDIKTTVLIKGDKVQYESSYLNMYMDEKNTFTIIHPQKLIVRADGGLRNKVDKVEAFATIQDTLFKRSTVQSCMETITEGKKVKEITLIPDNLMQNATMINKIIYSYDLKEKRVYQTRIFFLPQSPKKEEIITYNSLNYNSKEKIFTKAENMVFTDQGKLQSIYKNYEFIDNRKTSKK
ncbi:MAG: hypothetical protein ACK40G_01095 [Cytophagaceae bacterium]